MRPRTCIALTTAHSGGDGSHIASYGGTERLLSLRAVECCSDLDRLRALVWMPGTLAAPPPSRRRWKSGLPKRMRDPGSATQVELPEGP